MKFELNLLLIYDVAKIQSTSIIENDEIYFLLFGKFRSHILV